MLQGCSTMHPSQQHNDTRTVGPYPLPHIQFRVGEGRFWVQHLGNSTGNPGVRQANPHLYPGYPVSWVGVWGSMGFIGAKLPGHVTNICNASPCDSLPFSFTYPHNTTTSPSTLPTPTAMTKQKNKKTTQRVDDDMDDMP